MRLRYYNPQIKRFINQDIVTGEIGNSQSLNRFSYVQGNPVNYTDPFGMNPFAKIFTKDFAHTLLGFLSSVPGVGWIASGIDGVLYLSEENYAMATLCFMDTASFGLGKVGRLILTGTKLKNTGVLVIRTSAVLSKVSNLGQNVYSGIDSVYRMHEEGINGWDIFSLGVSAVGTFFSAKGLMDEVGAFRGTCGYKGFWNGFGGEMKDVGKSIKAEMIRKAKDNRGSVDIELLVGKRIANAVSKGGSGTYYFRGTSEGYPGNASVQRLGVTPTSTDPLISTIFAINSEQYGKGILYIANEHNLNGVSVMPSNVLGELEREVVFGIQPVEFANRATIGISSSSARDILGKMGYDIPTKISTGDISSLISSFPRLNQKEIGRFVKMAGGN